MKEIGLEQLRYQRYIMKRLRTKTFAGVNP